MSDHPQFPPSPFLSAPHHVLAAVDVETGGLDPARCGIVQIGAALVDAGGVVLSTYSALVQPVKGLEYSDEARAVHGVTIETQESGVPERRAIGGLVGWLEKTPVCVVYAHNSRFDEDFIESGFKRTSHTWPRWRGGIACSKSLARWLGVPPPYSLSDLCARYGIERPEPHDALMDAIACARLAHAMIAEVAR